MIKIDDLNRPPKMGETYLVPCYRFNYTEHKNEFQLSWLDVDNYQQTTIFIPVINHPHSDYENGQKYIHYHVDFRFTNGEYEIPCYTTEYLYYGHVLMRINKEFTPVYKPFKVINEHQRFITDEIFIQKSKFKKCIKNNRCPHRGYDLSQVRQINGCITCPLHGLKLNYELS